MANVRAQVTFQGASMLPEDRYVNTLHFSNGAGFQSHVAQIHSALLDFWLVDPPGRNKLGPIIATYVKRQATIRYYDLDSGSPRVPTVLSLDLPAPAATDSLPYEVAIAASFHGAPPVTPRRRGRMYLGPLNGAVTQQGNATDPTLVSSGVRQDIALCCVRLATAPNVNWCVLSQTDGTYVPITGGFVDNAFDTQRRRGNDATHRQVWSAAV